ncbi:hypothetical protein [Leptolinea tardivitalis]|uniref:hypothetical protein n=1 Tax=Leptolinea tardivitalis TaxID=229920 RepID=UPI0007814BE0|nr:hypothetical protein [Leptolinea tardivitalis]GAP21420.1 hypothetical protein LTAR_01631 [Leptolinea tardivitalis]
MELPCKNIAVIMVLTSLALGACQPAAQVPTATVIPTYPIPTPLPAATSAPQHPSARPDASRLDFSSRTMISGSGEIKPDESIQMVFKGDSGRKINIKAKIEYSTLGSLAFWGADGTNLIPQLAGLTEWEGVIPSTQDYYLDLHNSAQESMGYEMTIKMQPLSLPEATRIQFQPNTTGWHTPGELTPKQVQRFVLGAMAGQEMTIRLTTDPADAKAYLNIWSMDGTTYTSQSPTKDISIRLPASQDYYVELVSVFDQPVPYQLSVTIPPLGSGLATKSAAASTPSTALGAKIAKDQVIRSDAGLINQEIKGSVIRGERDRYSLQMVTGENFEVLVTSSEGNAVFTIIGPDNNPLPGTEEGKDTNNWSGSIKKEGTYAILVGPTRGNATYTLKVSITR